MGALNHDQPMSASGEVRQRPGNNVPRMAPLVSPGSSFSSTSSFGDKTVSSPSPVRLRRSTLDLGQLKSSGVLTVSETDLQHSFRNEIPRKAARMQMNRQESSDIVALQYLAVLQAIVIAESGIRGLINEARHHVRNVFGFFMNALFQNHHNKNDHNNKNSPGRQFDDHHQYDHHQRRSKDSRERLNEPPPDPLLSPARVTVTATTNSRDEWGHFADFQEELVDDDLSSTFLPSSSRFMSMQPKSLATLEESGDEHDEDDDDNNDDDAFSF